MTEMINITVLRQRAGGPPAEKVTYQVPFEKGMTALTALEYLYQNYAMAYRHSCDIGMCTICSMIVNGKSQMACKLILNEPQDLVFEPQRGHPVLRDLVTDWER